MSLRLYNTRTQALEPFAPVDGRHVRMYVCGLTPSAQAHLGHARSFLFFDVLRRYLVHLGYRVTYVRNVTDVDDRSIAAAQREGVTFRDIIGRHLASFEESMNRLGVRPPDAEPHATDYVDEMVAMIASLVDRAHAYVAADGVYYAVASFARYGALSRRNTAELLVGARIAPDEDKRDPLDFALWKFAKPGEPAWPAPWGDGRPGWHIECSAMSHALLGEPLDIHGGGYDLVFPHHENEIAQSEPLYGAPLASWWMHGGLLQFDGKKMSKSLGNFEPLDALLDRHDPQALRLWLLQAGYRKPLNFTEAAIEGATSGLRRLQEAYDVLRGAPAAPEDRDTPHGATPGTTENGRLTASRARFFGALDDDMNTSAAAAVLFDLAAAAPSFVEQDAASAAAGFMHEALTLLGLSPAERTHRAASRISVGTFDVDATAVSGAAEPAGGQAASRQLHDDDRIRLSEMLGPHFVAELRARLGDTVAFNGAADPDEAIAAVISRRNAARDARDFALADRLRSVLADHGVKLADSREGVTWSVDA